MLSRGGDRVPTERNQRSIQELGFKALVSKRKLFATHKTPIQPCRAFAVDTICCWLSRLMRWMETHLRSRSLAFLPRPPMEWEEDSALASLSAASTVMEAFLAILPRQWEARHSAQPRRAPMARL